MADYNSRFTGAQIDDGIEDTAEITERAEIWSNASGTTDRIAIGSIPVDPATGTYIGMYCLEYSLDSVAGGSTSDARSSSSFIITDIDRDVSGNGSVSITVDGGEAILYANQSYYNATSDEIYAHYDKINQATGAVSENQPLRVWTIWRLQKLS